MSLVFRFKVTFEEVDDVERIIDVGAKIRLEIFTTPYKRLSVLTRSVPPLFTKPTTLER